MWKEPIKLKLYQFWKWETMSTLKHAMHGRRNRGGGGHVPPPPIILPSEFFLTQYALLSRKLAHKMFIFSKIFQLASLANQDTSIKEIFKFICSNYFTSLKFYLKKFELSVLVQNIQKVCNQLFNIQFPSWIFKIIGYNFYTIPVPKSQEKKISCRQSFSSKLVQNITIMCIFYQNFSGGEPPDLPPPSI